MKNLFYELLKSVIRHLNNANEIQERELKREEAPAPKKKVGLTVHPETVKVDATPQTGTKDGATSAIKPKRKYTKHAKKDVRHKNGTSSPLFIKKRNELNELRKQGVPEMIKIGGRELYSRELVAKLLHMSTTSGIGSMASAGGFPRGERHTVNYLSARYVDQIWFEACHGCKSALDLVKTCTWHRGNDKKAKRVLMSEYYRWTGLPVEFSKGATRCALIHRINRAFKEGVINTYMIRGRRYINADELERWAQWWVDHKKFPKSGRKFSFKKAEDMFCIHENDLLWTWTNQMDNALLPDPRLRDKLRGLIRAPYANVNGTRYYVASALAFVKEHPYRKEDAQ